MRLTVVAALCALLLPVVGQADDRRVVSADGAITEIIYAIGAQDQLVAVDTTSRYPASVADLPRVGYLRALPFEGVLALDPDVLITTEEAAPDETLERLARAGVSVRQLPVARTPEATVGRVRAVGDVMGRAAAAERLATELEHQVASVVAKRSEAPAPRVLFLLAAGPRGVMIAGDNTAAQAMLETLGAENAVTGIQGYKPAGREALLASRPDAIVIAETRPGQFDIDDWPELAALPAWQQGHHVTSDSMLLLGFGPRLADALATIVRALPAGEQVSQHGS
ncbi:heme/hemin ABC transporter substrate-binding protein [Marinobacter zhanjiangensis]|uniref:Hemin ABC transporter substrate-binding protein n=1 Tax=Marinobacter zhanjiangensis TaxID=578215 RepID=A0ABQ3BA43_9GAMM|nr:helical backbone metal receptor [Marinobacter zhanjiangensis]GGY80743.1 hemin ABC transporter substrate-binding protein [Marinobacter zhanjiangensis]